VPATGGVSTSHLPANLQAPSTTAPAGPGVPDIPINPHAVSGPASGGDGGGVTFPPVTVTPQSQFLAASAGAGDPAVSGIPQAASTPASGGGGDPPSLILPQRASTTSAASNSSGGPLRKKRKLDEKQSKAPQGRAKK
jgi:hypothetical protein